MNIPPFPIGTTVSRAGTDRAAGFKYYQIYINHLHRVEIELGQREIPDLDEETDVECMTVAREQYRGRGDSTVKHRPVNDAVVVTDGGVATRPSHRTPMSIRHSSPARTFESPEQGGARYYRCYQSD